MQVFFDEDGQGSIDGGGEGAASFSYPYDTWMYNEVIIDMNGDWAEYKLDGVSIHGWQWSIGAFGQTNLNQLGGVNFYAWAGKGKGTPKYYFDNFMIEEFGAPMLLPPLNFTVNVAFENLQLTWDSPTGKELLGYNIYYAFDGGDFEILATTTETQYVVESPGPGLHAYYLTALYDEGESLPTNTQEVLLSATDEFEQELIQVYPNPAGDYISVNAIENISTIRLYNNAGQLLTEKIVNSNSYQFDLSDLDRGIYFIRLDTDDKSVLKQIIKK